MSKRRVVVTGLGLISPVGNSVETGWANLIAGQSGITTITKFDPTDFACKVGGEVKDFNVEDYMSSKEARTMDTFIHFGIAAAAQAVLQHLHAAHGAQQSNVQVSGSLHQPGRHPRPVWVTNQQTNNPNQSVDS